MVHRCNLAALLVKRESIHVCVCVCVFDGERDPALRHPIGQYLVTQKRKLALVVAVALCLSGSAAIIAYTTLGS